MTERDPFFREWPCNRVEGKAMQVLTYRMRDTHGKIATMIGMTHVGSPAFFREIEQRLVAAPGTILKEGPELDEEEIIRSMEKQLLYFHFWRGARANVACYQALGLDVAYQRDVLHYPALRTVNADLTLNEWHAALKQRKFDFSTLSVGAAIMDGREAWVKKRAPFLDDKLRSEQRVEAEKEITYWFWHTDEPAPNVFNEVTNQVRENRLLIKLAQLMDHAVIPWGALQKGEERVAFLETGLHH